MRVKQAFRFSFIISVILPLASTFTLSMSAPTSKLYDLPVSNNGARCRIILYKKEIPTGEVQISSPMDLGGLKTPEYLELNPQGKMPLLVTDSINIPESDTICRYLLSTYKTGADFQPDNPTSNLIARIHDMYVTTIQGCLYKAVPPFGIFGTRSDAIEELQKQLKIIDDLIDSEKHGIYLCGSEVSLADATLFPTMIFVALLLPKFGVEDALPPKIAKWYDEVREKDQVFTKVYDEVKGGIDSWESNGRWENIWMAGLRDEDPDTIFDKIISGDIPASIVHDDDKVLAFKDINAAAPAHLLVIPKDRMNLSKLRKSTDEHIEILGRLLVTAGKLANDPELGFEDGCRIVINDGPDAGQEVPHLHVHVLGGRSLTWPPG